jgi:hypothetical protein
MRITPFLCDTRSPEKGDRDLALGEARAPAIKRRQNLKQAGRRTGLSKVWQAQGGTAFEIQQEVPGPKRCATQWPNPWLRENMHRMTQIRATHAEL